jgi:S-adenosylmethionine:tRNA ribosyltransferase-isomerase
MRTSDFDYELPPERIAREPARPRDSSRMMLLDRKTGRWIDSHFRELPEFLDPSDVLVINDTRVIRARIYGRLERASETSRGEAQAHAERERDSAKHQAKPAAVRDEAQARAERERDSAKHQAKPAAVKDIEVLFAAPAGKNVWEVLCRPGKRIRSGDRIIFADGKLQGVFGELRDYGLRLLQLDSGEPVEKFLETHGHVPLPPYLQRDDTAADIEEYQTVYAKMPGAVAAPTAGLHFTPAMFDRIRARRIETLQITLHVGIGTFIPVRTEDPAEHVLKPERYAITEQTASRLNAAREEGRRIVAVGTTTTRTLEYIIQSHGRFLAGAGEADLLILPGYEFKAAGGMLTNFHLPKSTLIMLVSAFAGREAILAAYHHAVAEHYRFYSYGDCMLIL